MLVVGVHSPKFPSEGDPEVVELGPGGGERRRIGSGRPALRDGPADEAAFQHPVGIGAGTDADTGNHRIVSVDGRTGQAEVLAGGAFR